MPGKKATRIMLYGREALVSIVQKGSVFFLVLLVFFLPPFFPSKKRHSVCLIPLCVCYGSTHPIVIVTIWDRIPFFGTLSLFFVFLRNFTFLFFSFFTLLFILLMSSLFSLSLFIPFSLSESILLFHFHFLKDIFLYYSQTFHVIKPSFFQFRKSSH